MRWTASSTWRSLPGRRSSHLGSSSRSRASSVVSWGVVWCGARSMDTLSHGAWGYVALHRLPPLAWWGVFAGAAPDLFWFVPSKIEQITEKGWPALAIGREPGIWRADGPP